MFVGRWGLTAWMVVAVAPIAANAEWTVEKTEAGASVKNDGKLVTEYHTRSGTKPILWPLIGPTGKPVTRAFPMAKVSGEQADHPHQRSFWFTYGDVNGINFGLSRRQHRPVPHWELSNTANS